MAGVTKNVAHRGLGSSLDKPTSTAPVRRFQIQTTNLPAQHRDLMTKHRDFYLVGVTATQRQDHQLQHLTHDQIETGS